MFSSTKKTVFWILITNVLLVITGFEYQEINTYFDEKAYPPKGQFIDLGGYKLHMVESGNQGPTVILEAGLGLASLDWSLVQPEIAKFAHVVSYDRAGLGSSDESPNPRTSQMMVDELHALLKKANIPGPYILVGHSFGGMNILLYASQYPDEVAGLIFVDSVHELQNRLMVDEELDFLNNLTSWGNPKIGRITQQLGISRLLLPFTNLGEELHNFPVQFKNNYLTKISSSKFARAIYGEDSNFEDSLKQVENSQVSVQNKPVIVITAGNIPDLFDENTDTADKIWFMMQRDLALRSKQGKHLFAENSDHMIPWNQPEIIIQAVKELINLNSKF